MRSRQPALALGLAAPAGRLLRGAAHLRSSRTCPARPCPARPRGTAARRRAPPRRRADPRGARRRGAQRDRGGACAPGGGCWPPVGSSATPRGGGQGSPRRSGEGRPRAVINATGVIVHTNLGRAPWPQAAIRAAEAARGRSSWSSTARPAAAGTGTERARGAPGRAHRCRGRAGHEQQRGVARDRGRARGPGRGGGRPRVSSSRSAVGCGSPTSSGEPVRSWSRSGRRTGRASRTSSRCCARVGAAMVLRVHPSNFGNGGVRRGAGPAALAARAHRHGALVVDDLGSGALLDTAAFGLAHEPTPAERLADGADLVLFSGDKLVGGPQAGLLVGRADLVARLRRDPLARAMRPDKAMLAGIAATLCALPGRRGPARGPRMAPDRRARSRDCGYVPGRRPQGCRARGSSRSSPRSAAAPCPGRRSVVGPALARDSPSPDRLLGRLRAGAPAVVGRIERGAVVLDLRTVEPDADESWRGRSSRRDRPATAWIGPPFV